MKALHWTIAAAALAFAQAAPASAAVGDPEVIIYRVSGVVDNTAVATAFHCTNFSGVTETVRVVIRNLGGTLMVNAPINIAHLNTTIFATQDIFIFTEANIASGLLGGGTAAIAATSVNVTCTAMLIQPNVTNPVGIALHMTRFNPIPATQE